MQSLDDLPGPRKGHGSARTKADLQMQKHNARTIAVIFLVLSTCAIFSFVRLPSLTRPRPPKEALIGTVWVPTAFGHAYLPLRRIPESGKSIRFGDQGQYSGNGGCDLYSGEYTIDGNHLHLTPPFFITSLGCWESTSPLSQGRYFVMLDRAHSYRIEGDELTLLAPSNWVLVFRPLHAIR